LIAYQKFSYFQAGVETVWFGLGQDVRQQQQQLPVIISS
jgi:hypothetical protein